MGVTTGPAENPEVQVPQPLAPLRWGVAALSLRSGALVLPAWISARTGHCRRAAWSRGRGRWRYASVRPWNPV